MLLAYSGSPERSSASLSASSPCRGLHVANMLRAHDPHEKALKRNWRSQHSRHGSPDKLARWAREHVGPSRPHHTASTHTLKRTSSAPTNPSGRPERIGMPGNQAHLSGHATTSLLVHCNHGHKTFCQIDRNVNSKACQSVVAATQERCWKDKDVKRRRS